MNLLTTINGSLLEGFYPAGWDLQKFDACAALNSEETRQRKPHWNSDFEAVSCQTLPDFETFMGHEIALEIKKAKDSSQKLVLILPVGPMGMYRWVVHFLTEWNVDCSHVYGFNMDEWSDARGQTLDSADPGAFQNAMQQALYGPLGKLTVPESQRNFATRENLPTYPEKIFDLTAGGARLVTIFGIGRVCHIAFWEPHFAAEFASVEEWKQQTYRLGARLHPLTIEQNSLTSFKSRFTLVPATANTIGPGLFLKSDRIIGGCDGVFGRGMQWQGVSLKVSLHYGPDMWVPSSFMPTLPGRLFYLEELAQELLAECN